MKTKWLLFIMLLSPLVFAQQASETSGVVTPGNRVRRSGDTMTGTLASTVASGSNAVAFNTCGARISLCSTDTFAFLYRSSADRVGTDYLDLRENLTNGSASNGGAIGYSDAEGFRLLQTGVNIIESNTSATGGVDTAYEIDTTATLAAADILISLRNNNTVLNRFFGNGVIDYETSDQSADCDGANTANTASGKICIDATTGSTTVTNSRATAASLIFLTLNSDDATCVSVNVTSIAAGSFVVGCGGVTTATADTVVQFLVVNQ